MRDVPSSTRVQVRRAPCHEFYVSRSARPAPEWPICDEYRRCRHLPEPHTHKPLDRLNATGIRVQPAVGPGGTLGDPLLRTTDRSIGRTDWRSKVASIGANRRRAGGSRSRRASAEPSGLTQGHRRRAARQRDKPARTGEQRRAMVQLRMDALPEGSVPAEGRRQVPRRPAGRRHWQLVPVR